MVEINNRALPNPCIPSLSPQGHRHSSIKQKGKPIFKPRLPNYPKYSSNTHHPVKEHGITLIELLITLSLISVLFFFAQQSYQSVQRALHEEMLLYHFMQQLKIAKNLASIQDRAITLCGTLDGISCIAPKEDRWYGWLLFYDDAATFIPEKALMINSLTPQQLPAKGFYLQTTQNIGGGIHFKARRQYAYGMARSLANGRILLCAPPSSTLTTTTSQHYQFVINVYGYFRLTTEKGACP